MQPYSQMIISGNLGWKQRGEVGCPLGGKTRCRVMYWALMFPPSLKSEVLHSMGRTGTGCIAERQSVKVDE